MSKRIIALLTDFGVQDNYVGVMKGVMLSINYHLQFVDVSHNVSSYDIKEGAFLLYKSFSYFPRKTIFLVVLDPEVGSSRKGLAIETENYFFVGPDNGILSMAAELDGVKKTVVLENTRYFLKNICSTFNGRDIFAPVSAYISKGVSLSSLGREAKEIKRVRLPKPDMKENKLEGEIIYIDKFGNLITNINRNEFDNFIKNLDFCGIIKDKKIKNIYSCYVESKENEPFFIEGSFSFLEISLKNESAKKYFSIKEGEKVKILLEK